MSKLNRYAFLLMACIVLSSCSNSKNKEDNVKKQEEVKENKSDVKEEKKVEEPVKVKLESSELKLELKGEYKNYKFLGISNDKKTAYFYFNENDKVDVIKMDVNSKKVEKVYEKNYEKGVSLFDIDIFEKGIFLLESIEKEDKEIINVVTVSDGKVQEKNFLDTDVREGTTLHRQILKMSENKVFLKEDYSYMDSKESTSRLFCYDIEKGEKVTIDSLNSEYGKNEHNIQIFGEMDGKIYYSTLFQNTNSSDSKNKDLKVNVIKTDHSGKNKVKYESADFPSDIERKDMRQFIFLRGDDDVLVTSENPFYEIIYGNEDKISRSNIYLLNKDNKFEKSVPIPDIDKKNIILDVVKSGDFYVIYTSQDYYIYDKLGNLNLREKHDPVELKLFRKKKLKKIADEFCEVKKRKKYSETNI